MTRTDVLVAVEVTPSGPHPSRDVPVAAAAALYVSGARQATLVLGSDPPAGAGRGQSRPLDQQQLAELAAFVGRHRLVAHDLGGQRTLVALQGVALGQGFDTLVLSRVLLPELPDRELEALVRELGIGPLLDPLSSPLGRASAAYELLQVLLGVADLLPTVTRRTIAAMARSLGWDQAPAFARRAGTRRGRPLPGAARVHTGRAHVAPLPAALSPARVPQAIDADKMEALLAPGGAMARRVQVFEDRPEQRRMLRLVADALSRGDQLLVEAGTGTGKSLAYLLPAAEWARRNGRPVVVATHTINLQDQLWHHDLPLVRKLLGGDLAACLLKGRANYLCPSRLQQLAERPDLDAPVAAVLAGMLVWADRTETGDRAELTLPAAEESVWRSVSADIDACTPDRCPYSAMGNCFVSRARARAEAAHVIVVNHALLVSDMVVDHRLLPRHSVLVVDEAHHLEDVATAALGSLVSRRLIRECLASLTNDGQRGVLDLMAAGGTLLAAAPDGLELADAAAALRTEVREVALAADTLFDALAAFLDRQSAPMGDGRITPAVRAQPDWLLVETAWEPFDAGVKALARSLARLVTQLVTVQGTPGPDGHPGDALQVGQIQSAARSLRELAGVLARALVNAGPLDVVWTRRERGRALSVCLAPLSVADTLAARLFTNLETVVLTSATLRAAGGFDYVRQRLGLPDAPGHAVDSPFDYRRAVLFLAPSDMPEPDQPGYQEALDSVVAGLAAGLGGRTLVLYTSHGGLQATYHRLRAPLGARGIAVRGQGLDGDRDRLVGEFRDGASRTVLLGTRSFWEGIDVPGPALSCVVIARLPFDVPTDPVTAARADTYEDPFREFSLPRAVLRFRQGFGRLIRGHADRGVFVLLDSRVRQRQYGRVFLESLPACRTAFAPVGELPELARQFLEPEPPGRAQSHLGPPSGARGQTESEDVGE